MFSKEIQDCASRSVLCWLATSDAQGMPNVSPKEVFTLWGDREILIANIASPGSVNNITFNPQVCLCFIDVFVQKGYKLKGAARIVMPVDSAYFELAEPLNTMTEGRFAIQSVIHVQVSSVETVLAPSYQFYGRDVTEASQTAAAMKCYGVKPAN